MNHFMQKISNHIQTNHKIFLDTTNIDKIIEQLPEFMMNRLEIRLKYPRF